MQFLKWTPDLQAEAYRSRVYGTGECLCKKDAAGGRLMIACPFHDGVMVPITVTDNGRSELMWREPRAKR